MASMRSKKVVLPLPRAMDLCMCFVMCLEHVFGAFVRAQAVASVVRAMITRKGTWHPRFVGVNTPVIARLSTSSTTQVRGLPAGEP